MLTFTSLTASGTPSRIVGKGLLVIVGCAVTGLMLIAALTTTFPRLNGPATAGTTTDRPNGALL
jgi:hypothetical protein